MLTNESNSLTHTPPRPRQTTTMKVNNAGDAAGYGKWRKLKLQLRKEEDAHTTKTGKTFTRGQRRTGTTNQPGTLDRPTSVPQIITASTFSTGGVGGVGGC